MIERYASKEMTRIWSDENRFEIWQEVETTVCEVRADLGQIPKEAAGEIRANLHVGARPSKTETTDADRRIIERLAPFLRREGLYFVGVDVIGGYLTEVNVTSPTGVQEVNALAGSCLEARVIDWVEHRLRERDERSGRSERE